MDTLLTKTHFFTLWWCFSLFWSSKPTHSEILNFYFSILLLFLQFLFSGQRLEWRVNESLNDSEFSISNWVHSFLNFIGSERDFFSKGWGKRKMSKMGFWARSKKKLKKGLKMNGRKYGRNSKNGSSIIFKNYLLRSEDLRLRRYERSSESMEDREDDLLSRLLYLFAIL